MQDSPRILIKWPSRQRADRFFVTLAEWLRLLSKTSPVHFLFSFDREDIMSSQEIQTKLAMTFRGLEDRGVTFTACIGPKERTKVQAINADINEYRRPWDMLMLASDDMVPKVENFDLELIAVLPGKSPVGQDYLINAWDGWRRDALCTFTVMTRLYYDRFSYIYHPAYESLWCDNEQTDVARSLCRVIDIPAPRCLVEHQHPANNKAVFQWDDLYRQEGSNAQFAKDKATYEKRRASGAFDAPMVKGIDPFAAPPSTTPLLTIMIPTIVERESQFKRLLGELQRQCLLLHDPTLVEVLFHSDAGELLVGDKRQKLLLLAKGDYVCSIDDDDLVEPTYVADIVRTILTASTPPDCVVFEGRLTVDGRMGGRFDFDIGHQAYKTVGDLYQRTPNHLCPIRRELALKVGYLENKSFGEDSDYARRIYPMLNNQAVILNAAGAKKVLYHYRFSPSGTRTQRASDKARTKVT